MTNAIMALRCFHRKQALKLFRKCFGVPDIGIVARASAKHLPGVLIANVKAFIRWLECRRDQRRAGE